MIPQRPMFGQQRGPNPQAAQMNRGIGPSMPNSGPMNQPSPPMMPPMMGQMNAPIASAGQVLPEGQSLPKWQGPPIPGNMGLNMEPGTSQLFNNMKQIPGAGPMAPSGNFMQKFGQGR